jgi:hypothetical protein
MDILYQDDQRCELPTTGKGSDVGADKDSVGGNDALYKRSAGTASLFHNSAGSAPFSDKYKDDLDTLSSAQVCNQKGSYPWRAFRIIFSFTG